MIMRRVVRGWEEGEIGDNDESDESGGWRWNKDCPALLEQERSWASIDDNPDKKWCYVNCTQGDCCGSKGRGRRLRPWLTPRRGFLSSSLFLSLMVSLVMLSSLLRTSIICDFELGEKSDSNVILFIVLFDITSIILISFTRWLIKAVPMVGSRCLYKVTRCKRWRWLSCHVIFYLFMMIVMLIHIACCDRGISLGAIKHESPQCCQHSNNPEDEDPRKSVKSDKSLEMIWRWPKYI